MASKVQPPSAFFATEEERMAQNRALDADDVTNQGRLLLTGFIHDRMVQDGIINAPVVTDLQEPGTPCGPPMHHSREIARALRCIGDELDRDQKLQSLIAKVPPEAERKTFYNIASEIFADGVFNWGRVVTLFYLAYKVCIKNLAVIAEAGRQALDRIPLIRAVINLIMDIIREKVARWIIDRGGWEAIREYFGSTWRQYAIVTGAGVALAAGIYFYQKS